jgi:adenosylcobyric acid synthase
MVQGTSSSAGKSLLVTALCRHFARRGVRVAPFKAQNMSNNARVVDGGEIGTAQYLQALAARVTPEVRMNPVLLKPEADDRSQVVVMGAVDRDLSRRAWRGRARAYWPAVEDALLSLGADHDLVMIEGAGSPAEINLRDDDVVNMRVALRVGAPVVLVADIDRGGAFAHVVGTWTLLAPDERALLGGFVLNKFRGDASLLAPGPERVAAATGMPSLGVLPWLAHALPDEDGATLGPRSEEAARLHVAVVRYPTASNLDELKPLEQVAHVRWATAAWHVEAADLAVLPGSKHVAADLAWLRRTGLADAVARRAALGRPVLGICGGLQMLGMRVEDPAGVDGEAEGLGLLPLVTGFDREKITRPVESRFAALDGAWSALSGLAVRGYEIRHGRTRRLDGTGEALPGGLGFARGPVLGVTLHGLFENAAVLSALFGAEPAVDLDTTFDRLADSVAHHLDIAAIERLAGIGS